MKKILFISLLLYFPIMVSALEEGININCPNNIVSNQEFKCELVGYSSYEVSGLDYSFSLPDDVELIEFIVDKSWLGEEYNHRIALYTGDNKSGEFPIGEFVLKTKKDFNQENIKTKELLFVNEKFEDCYIVRNGVKELKSKENKSELKKSNIIKYVIILLIVVILVIIFVIIKVKIKHKKE